MIMCYRSKHLIGKLKSQLQSGLVILIKKSAWIYTSINFSNNDNNY